MSFHDFIVHFPLWLNDVSLYGCTTVGLSIHHLGDILVTFTFWQWWAKPLYTSMCRLLCSRNGFWLAANMTGWALRILSTSPVTLNLVWFTSSNTHGDSLVPQTHALVFKEEQSIPYNRTLKLGKFSDWCPLGPQIWLDLRELLILRNNQQPRSLKPCQFHMKDSGTLQAIFDTLVTGKILLEFQSHCSF